MIIRRRRRRRRRMIMIIMRRRRINYVFLNIDMKIVMIDIPTFKSLATHDYV